MGAQNYKTHKSGIKLNVMSILKHKESPRMTYYNKRWDEDGEVVCEDCGVNAIEIKLQSDKDQPYTNPHINLYSEDGRMFSYIKSVGKCYCERCLVGAQQKIKKSFDIKK